MNSQLAAHQDVGLRYLLEGGLEVVRNQPSEDVRRTQIIDSLVAVFSEADRGAEALRSQNLLFAVTEPPAFERFSIFFRYLKKSIGADIPSRLSEAKIVLDEIKSGQAPAQEKQERLESLIEALLQGLKRDRASAQLVAPIETNFI